MFLRPVRTRVSCPQFIRLSREGVARASSEFVCATNDCPERLITSWTSSSRRVAPAFSNLLHKTCRPLPVILPFLSSMTTESLLQQWTARRLERLKSEGKVCRHCGSEDGSRVRVVNGTCTMCRTHVRPSSGPLL